LLTNVAVRPDRAVVVVTHDSRVFQFADRIAHMDDGRIVDEAFSDQDSEVSYTSAVGD
jgi:putative ABC transport system ATP-binding protein